MTIQVSRKVGRPNYGSEEMSIFSQLPLADSTTIDEVEDKVKATTAFLKTLIFEQLGLPSTLGEDGVVREVDSNAEADNRGAIPRRTAAAAPSQPPAAAKKPSAPVKKQPAKSAAAAEKADLWREWVDSPDHFWDNRPEVTGKPKPNPRGPDFKHRESGKGLWIDEKTPAYARLVLDGAAEVVEDDEPF
jgi:hypothetical protein